MNLASFILLLLILTATFFALRKTVRSKGACDDCSSATCPVKGVAALEVSSPIKHDCCD